MKKLLAIFLCLLMCLVFSGCNNTEKKNDEAKTVLTKVLNKEENFTVHNVYVDKTTEENLEEFRYPTYSNALNIFVPSYYTFADFDSDGIEELLMVDATLSYFLILRYDGEKAVGYMVDDNIDLQNVKTNGTFLTVSYIFDDNFKITGKDFHVCEIEFNGLDYRVNTLASQNHEDNIYTIGKQSTTKDEVEVYIDNWKNNTTQIEWCTIGG